MKKEFSQTINQHLFNYYSLKCRSTVLLQFYISGPMTSDHIILHQSDSFSGTFSSKNKAQRSSSSVPQEASPEKLPLQTSPPECIWGKQLVSGESCDSIQMTCGGLKGIPTYIELSLLFCWEKVLDLCELLKTVRWIVHLFSKLYFQSYFHRS